MRDPGRTYHRFAVGDLVLLDEIIAAIVLRLRMASGVPLYDLRTEAGLIERDIVSGYVRPWPAERPFPSFRVRLSPGFLHRATNP